MRRKDESKKPVIVKYINDFFYEHDIQKVHQYADLDELTAYAAHNLIKAIYRGAGQEQRKTSPEHQHLL